MDGPHRARRFEYGERDGQRVHSFLAIRQEGRAAREATEEVAQFHLIRTGGERATRHNRAGGWEDRTDAFDVNRPRLLAARAEGAVLAGDLDRGAKARMRPTRLDMRDHAVRETEDRQRVI